MENTPTQENTSTQEYRSSTKLAIWTITSGALIACFLPWLLTQTIFSSGITFANAGEIGDTIGGIAGPVLSFTGLLVVYFSLQAQLRANLDQVRNFNTEQRRSSNENAIGSAFKIIDDLRKELESITKNTDLNTQLNALNIAVEIEEAKPAFKTMWKLRPDREMKFRYYPKFHFTEAFKEEASTRKGHREYIVSMYLIEFSTIFTTAITIFDLLKYFIGESALPEEQKKLLYNIVYGFYEPFVEKYLSGYELFTYSRSNVTDKIENITNTLKFLENKLNLSNKYQNAINANPEDGLFNPHLVKKRL